MAEPLPTLGILTCDRPENLKRCLEDNLRALAPDAGTEVVVYDDSKRPGSREANLGILAALEGSSPVPIRYLGRAEKQTLAAGLARAAQAPADLVDFALFGHGDGSPTFGANRNAALLDTAGRRALTVDDDTTAALMGQPGLPGAVLDPSGSLGDVSFFASLGDVVEAHAWKRTGALPAHARVLGQPLRAIGADLPEGRVIISQMGIAGDTGTSTPFGYLFVEGAGRERLTADPGRYSAACRSRATVRRFPRLTVSRAGTCMGHALGLDNRQLLPPFLPVHRNSDGLFGLAARLVHPEGYLAYLPEAIAHLPSEPRRWSRDAVWKGPALWRMSEVLTGLLSRCASEVTEADPAERLPTLGRLLSRMAELPPPAFISLLRAWFTHRLKLTQDMLDKTLQRHSETPWYWAADVRKAGRLTADLLETARNPAFVPIPLDIENETGSLDQTRKTVGRFGALMQAWPRLIAAASRIRGSD